MKNITAVLVRVDDDPEAEYHEEDYVEEEEHDYARRDRETAPSLQVE